MIVTVEADRSSVETGLLIELIGCVAAVIACYMFIPQALLVWKDRHDVHALEGVSTATSLAVGVQGFLWVIYNGAKGAWWGVVPNLFLIPLSMFILIILHRARREANDRLESPPTLGSTP